MKTMFRNSCVALVLLGFAAAALAQPGGGRGPRNQRQGGNYNVATETTFSGTVDEVQHISSPAAGPGGLHLMVRTEAGLKDVHLGPAAYIASKHVEFAKGDSVTVTGSSVTIADQDVVIAREVKKGDQTLTLRDAKGLPLWSGRAQQRSR